MVGKPDINSDHLDSHLARGERNIFTKKMRDDKIFRAHIGGKVWDEMISINDDTNSFPLLNPEDFASNETPGRSFKRETSGKPSKGKPSPSRKRRAAHEDCYPISLGIKLLIIFNFNVIKDEENRDGSHRDVENLKRTFKQRNFEVHSYEDLTKEETTRALEKYRNRPDLEKISSLVMVFMSHGDGKDPESFLSSDGKSISMADDVRLRFNDLNCPALEGKPKVMIGVCCRSVNKEKENAPTPPERKQESTHENSDRQLEAARCSNTNKRMAIDGKTVLSTSSSYDENDFNDMMTIYSCARGKTSSRDPEKGSIFVQTFCKIVTDYGERYDMFKIFSETQREMRKKRPQDATALEGYDPCMDPLTFERFYLA